MQSKRSYTTTRYIATHEPADVWDMATESITMPEILTNAQVWLEEYGSHLGDLLEDMLEEEAERQELLRFGSSGGF